MLRVDSNLQESTMSEENGDARQWRRTPSTNGTNGLNNAEAPAAEIAKASSKANIQIVLPQEPWVYRGQISWSERRKHTG